MSNASPDEPHSFIVQHEVAAGWDDDYRAWLGRISPVAKAFPGHLGVQVTPPVARPAGGGLYVTVIRFASRVDAERWIHASERAVLIEEATPMLVRGDRFTVKSGLDFWFTPEGAEAQVPVRWKQALITWSAIFPVVWLLGFPLRALGEAVPPLAPPLVQLFLGTGLAVLAMVYVVMPRYTRLVRGWLFSEGGSSGGSDAPRR